MEIDTLRYSKKEMEQRRQTLSSIESRAKNQRDKDILEIAEIVNKAREGKYRALPERFFFFKLSIQSDLSLRELNEKVKRNPSAFWWCTDTKNAKQ